MLYVTTREKYDAFTTARAVFNDRGADGGFYLPYRMPFFTADELAQMKGKAFGQNVADMINLLFSTHFTSWDVEFCIGRYPVRVAAMGQKVLVAECWRNLDGSYEKMERQIAARICGCGPREVKITSWVRIGIRLAVLFGIFAEILRHESLEDGQKLDVAVPAGDFNMAMAVWYGRQMGLPVANLVCGCADGSAVWNLLHNGQVRSSELAHGCELERLIYGTLGQDEAIRFATLMEQSGGYTVTSEQQKLVRNGLFASVISQERMASVIPNVYRTSSYIMEPGAAVSYAALMDHRARTGESRLALLLADRNPADTAKEVAGAMNMTERELRELLNR